MIENIPIKIKLKRVSEIPDVTLGVLINGVTGAPICVSLENPFSWNRGNVSCIPTGVYRCNPYNSEKYKNCYVVANVPNRTGILFHVGNSVKDTKGCILPGMTYGVIDGQPSVLNSGKAMDLLNDIIGNNRFILIIE